MDEDDDTTLDDELADNGAPPPIIDPNHKPGWLCYSH